METTLQTSDFENEQLGEKLHPLLSLLIDFGWNDAEYQVQHIPPSHYRVKAQLDGDDKYYYLQLLQTLSNTEIHKITLYQPRPIDHSDWKNYPNHTHSLSELGIRVVKHEFSIPRKGILEWILKWDGIELGVPEKIYADDKLKYNRYLEYHPITFGGSIWKSLINIRLTENCWEIKYFLLDLEGKRCMDLNVSCESFACDCEFQTFWIEGNKLFGYRKYDPNHEFAIYTESLFDSGDFSYSFEENDYYQIESGGKLEIVEDLNIPFNVELFLEKMRIED